MSKNRKPFWRRWWVWLIGVVVVAAIYGNSNEEQTQATEQEQTTTAVSTTVSQPNTEQIPPSSYEVVSFEDNSHKALTKSLSSYTSQEIEAIPLDKKFTYRVVVPSDLKQNQVEPTLKKVVTDITAQDNDLDELTIFMYSSRDVVNGAYDIGTATWAPQGKLGNITPEIAAANNRSSYAVTVDVKPDVEAYLNQRSLQEEKFGLSEEQRRSVFKEFVAAEDRAVEKADKAIPPNEDVNKNIEYSRELMAQYKAEIREKYSLSEDDEKQISVEAFAEGWPFE